MASLCKKALPFFSKDLTWIPGNGEKILIWEDSIMGQPPLILDSELSEFKRHLDEKGKKTLADISSWRPDESRGWLGWSLPDCPARLESAQHQFLSLLQGKAPIALSLLDSRGWGDQAGVYSVAAGYRVIKAVPHVPPDPAIWKSIWSVKSLPKVDHFSWLLAHDSVLTMDVLKRKGWEGPSRCSLCLKNEETLNHLFLECSYAKEVWKIATSPWKPKFPVNIPSLFGTWANLSPFSSHKKDKLACAWLTLPRFIFWKIWLERNSRIFRGISYTPLQVVIKIKSLLGDFLRFQPWQQIHPPLEPLEDSWITSLNPGLLGKLPDLPPPQLASWELRKESEEFRNWRKGLNRNSLFFDGASKGNPGEAGGGGVLLGPDENLIIKYSWGMGTNTNNLAEALALWQGLLLAQAEGIRDLNVYGDSRIIIQAINNRSRSSNLQLNQILQRIIRFLPNFTHLEFYHILRKLNSEADLAANEATLLSKGSLLINYEQSYMLLP